MEVLIRFRPGFVAKQWLKKTKLKENPAELIIIADKPFSSQLIMQSKIDQPVSPAPITFLKNVKWTMFKPPQMPWLLTNEHVPIHFNTLLFSVGHLNIYVFSLER